MKQLSLSLLTAIKIGLYSLGGVAAIASTLLFFSGPTVTIQSLESKTNEDDPIFNEITWIREKTKDIWMMNQSHHGLTLPASKWDRLAIVIDKSTDPKEVTFLQLPPGPLQWDDSLPSQKINYKVSCFMCHSNGPRAIRADAGGLPLSLAQKLKILTWNLRIKTYGRLSENKDQLQLDAQLKTPFRHRSKRDNQTLDIKTCSFCHNESKWGRGFLTRQNIISIDFLVKNQMMPPPGFSLSESERKQLQRFLNGF